MISIEQLPIVSDFREKHSITHSKLKERLEKLRISLVEDLMEPSIAFEITQEDKDESAPVATMGNFSVITGKAKSKKTFFISMILSEILNNQSNGKRKIRGIKQVDKSKVLYFDTEQSKYHFQKICKRISNEIGHESSDDFLAYALRGESPKDRFEVIDYAIQNTENLGYVIIDGVRDLVTSINDENESSMMATSLLKWSEEHDIHIIVVLHQNPSNDKARGHLGTELMNKAETVFLVQIDTANENNSSVVSPQLCRNKPFEPFAFYIDEDGVPILDSEYKTKSKNAQEAHEAIRPTDMSRHTVNIDRDQARLYDLIWKRTLASQMSDAELERTNVKIEANNHSEVFTASGEVLLFEGFLKVYLEGNDEDDEEQEGMLPALKVNERLDNNFITATERYSRAAARYTEASLVKKLEELGIGRPSTYAPTISTIINRNYVEKGNLEGQERKYTQLTLQSGQVGEKVLKENTGSDKGKLVPTDIGTIVTDFLVKNFDAILDYNFTAKVEQDFDEIAEGNIEWAKMMQEFYDKFHPNVKDVEANADRESGERILGTDPASGKPVSVRLGKFGPMAQIGDAEDEDKKFASLKIDQNIGNITLEDALNLFLLPKNLGLYKGEEVEVSNGRYGPYVRHGSAFISLPKGEDPLDVSMERAQELIDEKAQADAPIATYKGLGVQKGVGRFGAFIKWDGLFINVSKKYNFDNLSQADIEELIEDKLQKNIDKVIHNWAEEGIVVEKARWGRSVITKGKIKIELSKDVDASKLTLAQVQEMIEKKTPAKKTATKKAPAKKTTAKKK